MLRQMSSMPENQIFYSSLKPSFILSTLVRSSLSIGFETFKCIYQLFFKYRVLNVSSVLKAEKKSIYMKK